jgi:hypothetical protein
VKGVCLCVYEHVPFFPFLQHAAQLNNHIAIPHFSHWPIHPRDLERIFQAAATGFSCDSAQETRNSGKHLLLSLQPLLQVSAS